MLGFPIWAMITGKSHYTLILSDTFNQVKEHIYNIKNELETNKLLIKDFGPFEGQELWTATDIVIPKYNAKISARSTGQKVRGIRFKQWRPQLIVGDDLENSESVRTKEQRDKTFRWYIGEVIPCGDKETKYVLIGNLLHTDCLMAKIKKQIQEGLREGEVREYPIIQGDTITWFGKFPSIEEVKKLEKAVNDSRLWQREYLLKLVPEEGQEVKEEWIRYYEKLPDDSLIIQKGIGVDLAISKKETADYTAAVAGFITREEKPFKIYILPNPLNERLTGFETTERLKSFSLAIGDNMPATLWVEDVAYQHMQIEALKREGLPVYGIKTTTDKRARLRTVAAYIQSGNIVFPKRGCEDLIMQLVGFGIEAHDDLVDAFVYLVQGLIGKQSGFFSLIQEEKEKIKEQKDRKGLDYFYELYRKQYGED